MLRRSAMIACIRVTVTPMSLASRGQAERLHEFLAQLLTGMDRWQVAHVPHSWW
jgi:hypothetical protein